MNELIPLQPQTINGNAVETVSARELHSFLEVATRYNDWITKRVRDYDFQENIDYVCLTEKKVTQTSEGKEGAAVERVHYVSVGMAKELSMVERNEKGKQARKYFIECEKQLNAQQSQLPTSLRLLASIRKLLLKPPMPHLSNIFLKKC